MWGLNTGLRVPQLNMNGPNVGYYMFQCWLFMFQSQSWIPRVPKLDIKGTKVEYNGSYPKQDKVSQNWIKGPKAGYYIFFKVDKVHKHTNKQGWRC